MKHCVINTIADVYNLSIHPFAGNVSLEQHCHNQDIILIIIMSMHNCCWNHIVCVQQLTRMTIFATGWLHSLATMNFGTFWGADLFVLTSSITYRVRWESIAFPLSLLVAGLGFKRRMPLCWELRILTLDPMSLDPTPLAR